MSYILRLTAINQVDTLEPVLKNEGVSFKDMANWVEALEQEIKQTCPNVYCKIMKESLRVSEYRAEKSKRMTNFRKCFIYKDKRFFRNEISNGQDPAMIDRFVMHTTMQEMFGEKSAQILTNSIKRFLKNREQQESEDADLTC